MRKEFPSVISIAELLILLFVNIAGYFTAPIVFFLDVLLTLSIPLIAFLLLSSLFWILANVIISLAIVWHWGIRCRTTTITDQEIRRGEVCPARIRWEEVSSWGLATLYPQQTGTTLVSTGKQKIYVVSGTVCEDEIHTYGINQIWTWKCIKKYLPRLIPILRWIELHGKVAASAFFKTGDQLSLPDQIVWMKYTPELYQEIETKIAREHMGRNG